MIRSCEHCGGEVASGDQRRWCHACGLLLCADCFHATDHDHVHHLARQQVTKLPSEEFAKALPSTGAPWISHHT